MLLVIDNIPFSEEIWEFYFAKQAVVNAFDDMDYEIHPAMFILCPGIEDSVKNIHPSISMNNNSENLNPNTNAIQFQTENLNNNSNENRLKYHHLPFYKLWTMYYRLYQLSMDLLVHDGFDIGVISPDELIEQMEYLQEIILYWTLSSDHETREMVPTHREMEKYRIEDYLLNSERTSTSRALEVEVFYMARVIRNAAQHLNQTLSEIPESLRHMELLSVYDPLNTDHINRIDVKIKEIIRKHYEMDEFINEIMTFVVADRMTEDHKGIAYIRGYVLFGEEDMETDLPMSEVWRRLFPFYFDEYEDVFDEFYNQFTRLCIEHVYRFFFKKKELPWIHIPFYNVFVERAPLVQPSRVVEDIRYFIETDTLHQLYLEQVV